MGVVRGRKDAAEVGLFGAELASARVAAGLARMSWASAFTSAAA
jgi:hypothetical protein